MNNHKFISVQVLVVLMLVFTQLFSYGNDEITAYYKVTTLNSSMSDAVIKVKEALDTKSFEVIGEYKPGGNSNLYVVAFTRKDLQELVLQKKDRGLLAGILKVGLVKTSNGIDITLINPIYLFHAYLGEEIEKNKLKLENINKEVKLALAVLNKSFTPFGGKIEDEDLWDYHYMMGMPYFTDPVELKTFKSFDEGLSKIRSNLEKGTANTVKVYELIRKEKNVAIFGIGMDNSETGEAHFLPIIGENHVAAMPYEIVLQGNEATMLHGRYRIALHWPELTMGTFTQIMSTPGDIEEILQKIVD